MRYYISRHCQERYLERVLSNVVASSTPLIHQIFGDLNASQNITSQISDAYPRFVLYVKERYGKDLGFNFLKKGHTIFVLTKRKGTVDLYDVITCYIESSTLQKFAKTALSKSEIYTRLSNLKHK